MWSASPSHSIQPDRPNRCLKTVETREQTADFLLGHHFTGCGNTHVLCQGLTLVGPQRMELMRALAPEVLLSVRRGVFPQPVKPCPSLSCFSAKINRAPRIPCAPGSSPGFPVELVGVGELHAVPASRDRTRSRGMAPRTGNPGRSTELNATVVDCSYPGAERAPPLARFAARRLHCPTLPGLRGDSVLFPRPSHCLQQGCSCHNRSR